MAGTSFSLTEKLAVTGAFLALVVMAVGTEDDPGLVVTSHETIKELRRVAPAAAPLVAPPPAAEPLPSVNQPELPPPPSPMQPRTPDAPATPPTPMGADEEGGFSPKLGRMRRDFSNGPPDS